VNVVTAPETFKSLIRTCGAEELLELCDIGSLGISFMENMCAVVSKQTNVGKCHSFGLISTPRFGFRYNARKVADEEGGISGRKANRIFDRLNSVVTRTSYDEESIKGPQADLNNRGFLEEAIKKTLLFFAPEYKLPEPIIFRPETVLNFGTRYESNLDFTEVNKYFHQRVSPKDASFSPAYLLAQIAQAEPDIIVASKETSEFAVDPLKSAIASSKLEEVIRKATIGKERLVGFQEVVVGGSRSVREAVNSGNRNFRDVIHLVQHASKFKGWIQQADEDSLLRDEYCKSVAAMDWAETLPPKSLRFAIMTGLGIIAGLTLTPAAGVAAGIGLSASDYFLLDRLVKGWKPNQFVEGSLKPFLRKP